MMNLAEYRRKGTRLADYLPWAALVAPGVVLNKDGSLQRSARFRGPDLDSAVAAELVAVAGRINNAFRRLGSGWAIFVEAQRVAAADYPDSRFPDPASALLDAERRAGFAEQGAHFQSGVFSDLPLPAARRRGRVGRDLALRRPRQDRHRCGRGAARFHRTAPTGCWRSSTGSCRNATGSMTARR